MPLFKHGIQESLLELPNRDRFIASAKKIMAKSVPEQYAAVYMRLVNLGLYMVRHGANSGESVIKQITKELRENKTFKTVGRLESGSYIALAPVDRVEEVINEINKKLPTEGDVDGLVLKAGYRVLHEDTDIGEALVQARYAYEDVRLGSPVHSRLFDKGLETVYNRSAYVVEHLADAIADGEIKAYAQPIIRVLTGMICEVEILARWESKTFGFFRPDEFIPELERHQLIHQLDAEVVRLACKQWKEASELGINIPFGINLSRLDFELCDIFTVVTDIMRSYDVPVEQVHIEVTESALAQSTNLLMQGIQKFRDAGFELYLDDFGSGYSSLQVLEGKSFDVVKLDMSLLREVEENERARVIVADAISMIKRLNLQSLCEGVETEEQFLFLKAVGCEKAQGYFFSKPMSHQEIMAHLEDTAKHHETTADKVYYDSVGKVNLMDGTRSSFHGVEAVHFLGTQPFALVEIRGQSISFLSANAAFNRFVEKSAARSLNGLIELTRDRLSDLRNKVLYSASKARKTHLPQRFDIVLDGDFLTLGISFVESSNGRNAYLVEILSVTKYSQFNDFKLLEDSLRFLYTIFKRIDLLDLTDNTWRNIYLNVPRYTSLRAGLTPQDEIDAFANTFIHPDDRERFLTFYDLSTADERIDNQNVDHLTDIFFTLSDQKRYEDQLFMLIPVSMGGHKQFLSCMRDLDIAGIARQKVGTEGRISDDVLLSGILDITGRCVFWKDEKLRFIGANARFLEYYDFPSIESILGKTDEELGWTRNPHFTNDEKRVLAGEQIVDAKGYTERRGELRDIRISRMPLWDEGKVIGLVGIIDELGPHKESSRD